MKNKLVPILFLFLPLCLLSQKVFEVDRDYKSKDNDALWFFTDADYRADFKIFMVDSDYKADLKVFFVDRDYKAKWRSLNKKREMEDLKYP